MSRSLVAISSPLFSSADCARNCSVSPSIRGIRRSCSSTSWRLTCTRAERSTTEPGRSWPSAPSRIGGGMFLSVFSASCASSASSLPANTDTTCTISPGLSPGITPRAASIRSGRGASDARAFCAGIGKPESSTSVNMGKLGTGGWAGQRELWRGLRDAGLKSDEWRRALTNPKSALWRRAARTVASTSRPTPVFVRSTARHWCSPATGTRPRIRCSAAS